MGWPHERLSLRGSPDYTIAIGIGKGKRDSIEGLPSLDDVKEWIELRSDDRLIDRARNLKLRLHKEDSRLTSTAVSKSLSLLSWLAYEVDIDGVRYCLHEGRWYQMDQSYSSRIEALVAEAFLSPPPFALPLWDRAVHDKELDYNRHLASNVGGLVLDQKLITTDLHRYGIEACDVFVPGGTYVHVKRSEKSSAVSHLLAQALISTDALRLDQSAREAVTDRFASLGHEQQFEAPKRVVIGFARDKVVNAETLFTFSKVNLIRQKQLLAGLGVDVVLAHVPLRNKVATK